MRAPPNIAVLGADDPLGEAVLRLIGEQGLEIGTLFPLSLEPSEGCVSARGEALPLMPVEGFGWSQVELLINVSRSATAARWESQARASGCTVLGLGGAEAGRIGIGDGLSLAMIRVFQGLRPLSELARVSVTAMLPVAAAGEAGIAELANQTRALFAMETLEPEVFPVPIAFNLVPQVGGFTETAARDFESHVAEALRQGLDRPSLPVAVTAAWAPLFYGAALSVDFSTEVPVDVSALRTTLARVAGLTLMDADLPGGVATPATDAQDSATVFLSRLRETFPGGRDLAMWLVIDMTRLEAARMVDQLENLIEQ